MTCTASPREADKGGLGPGTDYRRAVTLLAEEGLRAVPESRGRIDELVTDCQNLARTPTA